jgi:hypothetical protein
MGIGRHLVAAVQGQDPVHDRVGHCVRVVVDATSPAPQSVVSVLTLPGSRLADRLERVLEDRGHFVSVRMSHQLLLRGVFKLFETTISADDLCESHRPRRKKWSSTSQAAASALATRHRIRSGQRTRSRTLAVLADESFLR